MPSPERPCCDVETRTYPMRALPMTSVAAMISEAAYRHEHCSGKQRRCRDVVVKSDSDHRGENKKTNDHGKRSSKLRRPRSIRTFGIYTSVEGCDGCALRHYTEREQKPRRLIPEWWRINDLDLIEGA
jgi:hypothetical protein